MMALWLLVVSPVLSAPAYTDGGVDGMVWSDLDNDGIYDPGEPGIPDINVRLYRLSNQTLASNMISNAQGRYRAVIHPPANGDLYYLQVDVAVLLDAGYAPVRQNINGGSAFSFLTGMSDPFTLRPNTPLLTNLHLGLLKIPECEAISDLIFLLDGSPNLGDYGNNFSMATRFTSQIVRAFTIGPNLTRVGVIQAGRRDHTRVELSLGAIASRPALISTIINIPRIDSLFLSNMAQGFMLAEQEFNLHGRDNANPTIILLTDGRHHGPGNPVAIAQRLQSAGIRIFVLKLQLSVDRLISQQETNAATARARAVASAPHEVFLREGINGLSNLTTTQLVPLLYRICSPNQNYSITPQVTLYWSRVSWAAEYELQVTSLSKFEPMPLFQFNLSNDEFQFMLPPLPDGFYNWRIRARRPIGVWGAWSDVQSFTIDVPTL